jgi:hypothetical protein
VLKLVQVWRARDEIHIGLSKVLAISDACSLWLRSHVHAAEEAPALLQELREMVIRSTRSSKRGGMCMLPKEAPALLQELREMVIRGAHEHPGAVAVEDEQGRVINLARFPLHVRAHAPGPGLQHLRCAMCGMQCACALPAACARACSCLSC